MILASSAGSASAKFKQENSWHIVGAYIIWEKEKNFSDVCLMCDAVIVVAAASLHIAQAQNTTFYVHEHLCSIYAVWWKSAPYISKVWQKNWEWSEKPENVIRCARVSVWMCVCDRNNVGDDVIDVTTFSVAGYSIHTQNILREVVFLCVVLGLCCVNGNW